jgi:hypothetical protein
LMMVSWCWLMMMMDDECVVLCVFNAGCSRSWSVGLLPAGHRTTQQLMIDDWLMLIGWWLMMNWC